MELKINPERVSKFLVITITLLFVLNCLGIYFRYIDANFYLLKFWEYFDFDFEDSLPTLFSYLLLLVNSVLLWVIYRGFSTEKNRNCWKYLSFIFFFLSMDEILSIHENLIPLMRIFELEGIFYFSWIIPYSIIGLCFLVLYIPFLNRIPKRLSYYFVLSGIIYVAGAIGLEAFEGKHFQKNGYDHVFSLYYTIEEALEMIGLSIFFVTLLKFKFQECYVSVGNNEG